MFVGSRKTIRKMLQNRLVKGTENLFALNLLLGGCTKVVEVVFVR